MCNMIKDIKCYTKAFFGKHQVLERETQKWHVLEHLPKGLQEVKRIEFFQGGVFEASHKLFRKLYSKSSRKRKTAMGGGASQQPLLSQLSYDTRVPTCQRHCFNHCRSYAVSYDTAITVQHELRTTLPGLE